MLNADGTRSLYDNKRFDRRRVFHEQIFVFSPVGVETDLSDNSTDIGGSFTVITGGWEFDSVDLSLLDFLKVSGTLSSSSTSFEAEVGFSIWSPSISFDAFGGSLTIGVNLGVVYGIQRGVDTGIDLGVFSISYSK